MHDIPNRVHVIGQAPAGTIITGPQQRALRKPLRALAAAIRDLAPHKAPQWKRRRLLYRRDLSESDLDLLLAEIGLDRLRAAVDRATQPQLQLQLVAAE